MSVMEFLAVILFAVVICTLILIGSILFFLDCIEKKFYRDLYKFTGSEIFKKVGKK